MENRHARCRPLPSAWDAWCRFCRARTILWQYDPNGSAESHSCCIGCDDGCGVSDFRARWGHEWAAVVWMRTLLFMFDHDNTSKVIEDMRWYSRSLDTGKIG